MVDNGEYGRFDMYLNADIICTTGDHNNNGAADFAPGSCSAVADAVAGNNFFQMYYLISNTFNFV